MHAEAAKCISWSVSVAAGRSFDSSSFHYDYPACRSTSIKNSDTGCRCVSPVPYGVRRCQYTPWIPETPTCILTIFILHDVKVKSTFVPLG